MNKRFALVMLAMSVFNFSFAQQVRPSNSADIYRRLQKLKVLGTVMYVAAHPDDENTRLLSYLVHHDHVQTVYLSLTRGDGGQNILGNEQGATLGLIRTHELLEARNIDGAEQMFTPVIDFGYTKSPEETFRFWNRKELVKKVVEAYRFYKPDVIICRFPTTGEGGHGQHTVSAIVAEDAYLQLEKELKKEGRKSAMTLPKRLLFNSFRFGDRNTTSEDQFKVSINQYDPLLGEGYGEMAGRSRSVHKSQGAGTPQTVGVSSDYFKLILGEPIKESLYDGVDLSWGRVGRPEITAEIDAIIKNFNFTNPSASLPALVALNKKIATVEDIAWRAKKIEELNEIVLSCAGVMIEVLGNSPEVTPGSSVPVSVGIVTRSSGNISLKNIAFKSLVEKGGQKPVVFEHDSLYKFNYTIKVGENHSVTEPYWMRYQHGTGSYDYEATYNGEPEARNDFNALVTFEIGGELFYKSAPVSFKRLDPVRGDVVERVRIVPDISIEPYYSLYISEPGKSKAFWLRIKSFATTEKATVAAFKDKNQLASLELKNLYKGLDTLISLTIPAIQPGQNTQEEYLTFNATTGEGKVYDRAMHLVQYDHLPTLQYFSGARAQIVPHSWKVAVKKVGYVDGAGDYVAEILNLCGLEVGRLSESAINNPKILDEYEAVIIGIRALNTRREMAHLMPALLEYVNRGGTLIVQYNTSQNLVTDQLGPYPFKLSRDRVTEEDAVVTFTDPSSRLLHYPNEITSKDFDAWVQERGVYYPTAWDGRYKTILSMHDTGEKPLESGVLYTQYGKGQFIYSPLAFFRQLPAGNTGAIKLLMNFLSAGK